MNHLIIFAHPNSQSFNTALLEKVCEASQTEGVNLIVRNLYQMNFNPVLEWPELSDVFRGKVLEEIKQEQQYIQQADLITLIYPLWWMGFPAILKGYFDRVLTHGFAYKTDETGSYGLLQGKKMQQFITIGNNVATYEERGFAKSLDDCLINGLFNYCSITDIEHTFLGDIHIIDDNARKVMLALVKEKTENKITTILS